MSNIGIEKPPPLLTVVLDFGEEYQRGPPIVSNCAPNLEVRHVLATLNVEGEGLRPTANKHSSRCLIVDRDKAFVREHNLSSVSFPPGLGKCPSGSRVPQGGELSPDSRHVILLLEVAKDCARLDFNVVLPESLAMASLFVALDPLGGGKWLPSHVVEKVPSPETAIMITLGKKLGTGGNRTLDQGKMSQTSHV